MEQPMRIAQIIGKWVGGGVESFVLGYYRNIDKNLIQFDFICDEDSICIPYEEIEKMGGRVILVPPYQKLFKYNRELKKIFKKNKYKIVHSHINSLSMFPLRIAKKCKIPIRIAHSHSLVTKKSAAEGKKRTILKQVLKRFSKIYSTNYYACSEEAGKWLFGKRAFNKGKIEIINNAIEIEKFKYDEIIRAEERTKLGISDETRVIGHVGRFVGVKNHQFILKIFNEICKEHKNFKLLLIGQGPLETSIKSLVKEYMLEEKVVFLGQCQDVNRKYQAMDAFIFPSLYEGLGLVLVEAQTSGLPCIASTCVPTTANVTNSVEYIDLNESCEIWATAIINKTKTQRKDKSKEISNGKYSIKEEADKLKEKYINLINNL